MYKQKTSYGHEKSVSTRLREIIKLDRPESEKIRGEQLRALRGI